MDTDGWYDDAMRVAHDLLAAEGPHEWRATTLTGTGGGTFGSSVVSRFRSPERTAIVKIVQRNEFAPDHPLSWRRELDVYESEWLRDRLPPGFRTPECLTSATTDQAAVIIVADVPFDDPGDRTAAWYGELATLLARMSSAAVDDGTVPSWASRGFLEHELAAVDSAIPDVVEQRSPAVDEVIDVWRPLLTRLEPVGGQLVDALSAQPIVLNHLDAFSRNAARVGEDFVMIDWAYTGLAPVGCDAAALIAITGMAREVPGGDLDALRDAVTTGYAAGLAAGGVHMSAEQLDMAIDIALTLRFAGFLTQIHRGGDDIAAMVENVSGRPFSEARSAWTDLARSLVPAAERSLAAVGA